MQEWFDQRPDRLGHLARRALLRLRDSRRAGQVLLRLARRADRLHGQLQEPVRRKPGPRLRRRSARPGSRRPSCSTSSARTSSTSTRCSGRRCCAFAGYRTPDRSLRPRLPHRQRRRRCPSRAAPSSPPRATSSRASTRSGCATTTPPSSTARMEDIDLNLEDFVARVNSDLVGKYVNIASRCAGFVSKRFGGRLIEPERRAAGAAERLEPCC